MLPKLQYGVILHIRTGELMNKIETISLHIGHIVNVEITPSVEQAIRLARQAIEAGQTKVAAVRMIYPAIANLPRELIWYAIIHGANLSSRGAVTYYYNMRRKPLRK